MTSRALPRSQPSSSVWDLAWRVLAVAIVSMLLGRLLGLLTGQRPALTADYFETVAIGLITGAVEALVLTPLARRLPYGMWTRFLVLFVPLYWIGLLSNLVEAAVNTDLPAGQLVAAAVIFAIPNAVTAWMIAWLFPATEPTGSAPGIGELLRRRSLLSWAWRILVAALLFAAFIELFGVLWGPLIARYYQDPTYIAQAHTVKAPDAVVWPEEVFRGIVFVLVLLPVLAVMPGREPAQLVRTGAYVALINAAFESWLPMLGMTSFPLGFRIGEGLDLTTDALVRGIIVATLLALPKPVASTEAPPSGRTPARAHQFDPSDQSRSTSPFLHPSPPAESPLADQGR